jgi:hypothetical protein
MDAVEWFLKTITCIPISQISQETIITRKAIAILDGPYLKKSDFRSWVPVLSPLKKMFISYKEIRKVILEIVSDISYNHAKSKPKFLFYFVLDKNNKIW